MHRYCDRCGDHASSKAHPCFSLPPGDAPFVTVWIPVSVRDSVLSLLTTTPTPELKLILDWHAKNDDGRCRAYFERACLECGVVPNSNLWKQFRGSL